MKIPDFVRKSKETRNHRRFEGFILICTNNVWQEKSKGSSTWLYNNLFCIEPGVLRLHSCWQSFHSPLPSTRLFFPFCTHFILLSISRSYFIPLSISCSYFIPVSIFFEPFRPVLVKGQSFGLVLFQTFRFGVRHLKKQSKWWEKNNRTQLEPILPEKHRLNNTDDSEGNKYSILWFLVMVRSCTAFVFSIIHGNLSTWMKASFVLSSSGSTGFVAQLHCFISNIFRVHWNHHRFQLGEQGAGKTVLRNFSMYRNDSSEHQLVTCEIPRKWQIMRQWPRFTWV